MVDERLLDAVRGAWVSAGLRAGRGAADDRHNTTAAAHEGAGRGVPDSQDTAAPAHGIISDLDNVAPHRHFHTTSPVPLCAQYHLPSTPSTTPLQ